jgi:hypothetical protein
MTAGQEQEQQPKSAPRRASKPKAEAPEPAPRQETDSEAAPEFMQAATASEPGQPAASRAGKGAGRAATDRPADTAAAAPPGPDDAAAVRQRNVAAMRELLAAKQRQQRGRRHDLDHLPPDDPRYVDRGGPLHQEEGAAGGAHQGRTGFKGGRRGG